MNNKQKKLTKMTKEARIEILKSIGCGLFTSGLDFLITAFIIYIACHDFYANLGGAFTGIDLNGLPYEPPTSVYIYATAIGFTVSVAVNYILSYLFVYKNGNVGKNSKGFLKFVILSAIGLGLTSLGSYIGYDLLGCNIWLTKLVVCLIVFVYNFITRKIFIFNINLIRDDENTIRL